MKLSIQPYKWSITDNISEHKLPSSSFAAGNKNCVYDKGVSSVDTFISNVPSFTSINPEMEILRGYAKDFRCAYTGLRMISFNAYKHLLQLASKKKNDKNLIRALAKYQDAFDGLELEVFKFYKHNINSTSKHITISEVTDSQFPISYENLKKRYLKIIVELKKLATQIKSEKRCSRYTTILEEWESELLNGNYTDAVNSNKYLNILMKMKNKLGNIQARMGALLLKLPNPSQDFDAFIVKSKSATNRQFVDRLVSPFIVSIEHVKAKNRGGHASSISNCILVRARENCEKSDKSLDETLTIHPDWIKNIQEYFSQVIAKVNHGGMRGLAWYPFEIKNTLEAASGRLKLDSTKLIVSRDEAYKTFTV